MEQIVLLYGRKSFGEIKQVMPIKNVLKQLKEQVKEVRKHQREAYGKE
jgi:hypothetical protein